MAGNPYSGPYGVAGDEGVRRVAMQSLPAPGPPRSTGQTMSGPPPQRPFLGMPTPGATVSASPSGRTYSTIVPRTSGSFVTRTSSDPAQETGTSMSLINRQVEQMTRAVEEQQRLRAERRQQTREDLAQMRKLAEDRYKSGTKAMELLSGLKSGELSGSQSSLTVRSDPNSPETPAYPAQPLAENSASRFQFPSTSPESATYPAQLPSRYSPFKSTSQPTSPESPAYQNVYEARPPSRYSPSKSASLPTSPESPAYPAQPPAENRASRSTAGTPPATDLTAATYGQTFSRSEATLASGATEEASAEVAVVATSTAPAVAAPTPAAYASAYAGMLASSAASTPVQAVEYVSPAAPAGLIQEVEPSPPPVKAPPVEEAESVSPPPQAGLIQVVDYSPPAVQSQNIEMEYVAPPAQAGLIQEVEYVPPPTVDDSPSGTTIEYVYATHAGTRAPPVQEPKAALGESERQQRLESEKPQSKPSAPQEVRDLGSAWSRGWTERPDDPKPVFSPEQQLKLGVSEAGKPLPETAALQAIKEEKTVVEIGLPPENTAPAATRLNFAKPENKKKISSREVLYAQAAPSGSALEAPLLAKPKEKKAPIEEEEEPSCRKLLFLNLEGETVMGSYYLGCLTVLVLVNYACFAFNEESWAKREKSKATGLAEEADDNPILNNIETTSVLIFTADYLMRVWTCVYLSKDYGPKTSMAGEIGLTLWWMSTNIFSLMDLASIGPFYIDLFTPGDTFRNTSWIRVARIFKLLPPIDYRVVWAKSYKLLMAGGFVGFTTWIICASLYYMFERHNEDMAYVIEVNGEDKLLYNRFQSIPLAMYFSLLNFGGEYPLADNHSIGGRFVAVFIQFLGAAVLAIPSGALGNAFGDVVSDSAEDDEEDDGGDDAAGDAKVDNSGKPKLESPLDSSFKVELLEALDGKTGVLALQLPYDCGELDLGTAIPSIVNFLSAASVVWFVFANMRATDSLELNDNATDTLNLFGVFNAVATFLLAVSFGLRLYCASEEGSAGCLAYLGSMPGMVDLTCWLFPFLSSALSFMPESESYRRVMLAFTVVRILKLDRSIGAFSSFKSIFWKTRKVFMVTGAVALILWLQCSAIMYYVERRNPDPDMSMYYNSVTSSMWVTLLNLSGEAPLCDYTTAGKWVTAFMAFFGVGFVSIPMGILGSAFEEELDDDEDEDAAEGEEVKKEEELGGGYEEYAAVMKDSDELTPRQRVYKFLEGSAANQAEDLNPWEYRAVLFEKVVWWAIGLSALETVLETEEDVYAQMRKPVYSELLQFFQVIVVLLFSTEYVLRYYTAPEDPYWKKIGYRSDAACRFAYVTSLTSIIDFFAIAPFYAVMLGSDLADQYDGQLRMLRVFRLLTLDKYIPSISLISRILKNRAKQFQQAGYAALCCWAIFSTLLWLTEENNKFQVDSLTQAERYRSVVNAAPYTLVHLTGDYPLIDYTVKSKIVLFIAVLFAVGIVSVPTGLLASGFQSELKALRAEQKAAIDKATTTLQRFIRSCLLQRKFRKVVAEEVEAARNLDRRRLQVEKDESFMKTVSVFLNGKTKAGRMWGLLMPILGLSNCAAVILETIEPVREALGQTALDTFELFSVLIFTTGYCLQIYAAPMSSKYSFQRWNYISNFFGIVDLITILPWWVQTILGLLMGGQANALQNAFIFRVFRLLRLLQLEDFLSAFTLLDDAWRNCRDTMVATLFLATIVWVCGAVLFYNFEKGNPNFDGDPFGSLPMSLYYTGIFLGGEWALIDFTPCGQVVCIFYCVAGIGLHGIPIGAVFEAFSNVIEDVDILDAEEDERNN